MSSCTPAGALLAASAAFCTAGDVLVSYVPTGASHVWLLAYCKYVVLRHRWFHAHALVSCILGYQIGLVVRGYYASPCSLHTCEYSVGIYVLGASTGLLRACDYIGYLPINGIA